MSRKLAATSIRLDSTKSQRCSLEPSSACEIGKPRADSVSFLKLYLKWKTHFKMEETLALMTGREGLKKTMYDTMHSVSEDLLFLFFLNKSAWQMICFHLKPICSFLYSYTKKFLFIIQFIFMLLLPPAGKSNSHKDISRRGTEINGGPRVHTYASSFPPLDLDK